MKFTCPSCDQNAWGKPDLAITCTPCELEMQAERVTADDANTPSYQPITSAPAPIEVLPSHELQSEPEPAKRKPGRPKGSKNKPKEIAASPSYQRKPPRKNKRKGKKPIAVDEVMEDRPA